MGYSVEHGLSPRPDACCQRGWLSGGVWSPWGRYSARGRRCRSHRGRCGDKASESLSRCGNANQNLGNKLGSRPCVRQTDNYRRYEGGNSMKALLGHNDLQWSDPPRARIEPAHHDDGVPNCNTHTAPFAQVRASAARAPRDLGMFDVPVARVEPGQRFVQAGQLPMAPHPQVDRGLGRRGAHIEDGPARAPSFGASVPQAYLSPAMMNKARQASRSAPWDR